MPPPRHRTQLAIITDLDQIFTPTARAIVEQIEARQRPKILPALRAGSADERRLLAIHTFESIVRDAAGVDMLIPEVVTLDDAIAALRSAKVRIEVHRMLTEEHAAHHYAHHH